MSIIIIIIIIIFGSNFPSGTVSSAHLIMVSSFLGLGSGGGHMGGPWGHPSPDSLSGRGINEGTFPK